MYLSYRPVEGGVLVRRPYRNEMREMKVTATPEQMQAYLGQRPCVLIQDALPDATADEREFIISGVTPQEWEKLFG